MGSINAKTAVCGLIGNPVGHSISPLIHNTLSERLGIDLAYVAFPVEKDQLPQAVRGAYALNIKGLNVTVPHKQAVMDSLTEVDPLAKAVGAVNTLVRTQGGYKGYNTDYLGLHRQLLQDGIIIKGEEIIILGAGGASRAATFMCAAEGAAKIYLLNRTLENAVRLSEDVNRYIGRPVAVPMGLSDYRQLAGKKYTVIQTTNRGMFPQVDEAPIEDEEFYGLVKYAVDIIFNPAETLFMKRARAHGAEVHNGLGMLLYQGAAAFELWNDVKIPPELCGEIYEMMKREMGGR